MTGEERLAAIVDRFAGRVLAREYERAQAELDAKAAAITDHEDEEAAA